MRILFLLAGMVWSGAALAQPAQSTVPASVSAAMPMAAASANAPQAACLPEHAAMGHCKPATTATTATTTTTTTTTTPATTAAALIDPDCRPEHAAQGHCTPKAAPDYQPPHGPPPPAALSGPEYAADAVWGAEAMAPARHHTETEHGGMQISRVLLDRLEYRARDGGDGYAWEGDAWIGGDYDKLWIKSEGEGDFKGPLETAEVQALWSHAIGAWFDVQGGVRYDFGAGPDRTHLAIGVQGLAPYWFEVDLAAFLSDRGDLTARVEAEYDQRITTKLILQPRIEANLAAQDIRSARVGAGLSTIEAGLRLRYEFVPEFAPYLGVAYERNIGRAADFARAAGDDVGGWNFVFGLRSWF